MKKEIIKFSAILTFVILLFAGCESKKQLALHTVNSFSDGVAWVDFQNEDDLTITTALIDTSGKIVFDAGKKVTGAPFEGGMGYYTDDGVDYILNTSGKLIGSSESLGFETIEAYDDGVMLLSKRSAGNYLFGVISAKGEWVFEMTSIQLPTDYPIRRTTSERVAAYYAGDDVFTIYAVFEDKYMGGYSTERASVNWVFLNWKTGDVFYLLHSGLNNLYYKPYFRNGTAYIPFPLSLSDRDRTYSNITIGLSKDLNSQETQMTSEFKLTNTGDAVNTDDIFKYVTGNRIVTVTKEWLDDNYVISAEYYDVKNIDTGHLTELRDFSVNQVVRIDYTYGYGLAAYEGVSADGWRGNGVFYFVVLDDDGNNMFEPIPYDELKYSDTNIVYKFENSYTILDIKGNVLAENLKYSSLGPVVDGLAAAAYDDGCCYIDAYGNVMIGKAEGKSTDD